MARLSLTDKQFSSLVSENGRIGRISESNTRLAYLVLVELESYSSSAREFGVSRQSAEKVSLRVYKKYQSSLPSQCPSDFLVEEFCVPNRSALRKLRALEAELVKEFNQNQKKV